MTNDHVHPVFGAILAPHFPARPVVTGVDRRALEQLAADLHETVDDLIEHIHADDPPHIRLGPGGDFVRDIRLGGGA